MTRFFTLLLAAGVSMAAAGCQPAATSNSNSTLNSNATTTAGSAPVNLDSNRMPPGNSAAPVSSSANSNTEIPSVGSGKELSKGATPTPGIPDPKTMGKPLKPGATPTPGIPDPETIRRQMSGQAPIGNVNSASPTDNQMRPMKKGITPPRPANKPI